MQRLYRPTRHHPPHPLRRAVYETIEVGRGDQVFSRIFDASILTLILLNVAAFVLETVPEYGAAYASEFEAFNVFSVAIFTIEYLLRLWTAVEVPFLRHDPPWKARLKLAATPALIIDLLAILPFYVQAVFGMDLRILRVLRLLRFLKLSRYSPALHTLMRVLSNERRSLLGAGLLLATALLFASSGIYLIESHAQPDKFGSIPASAWWAIATLTTVGYGDIVPITPLGRIFGSVVMVTGLCILALPVAIISAGFAQETSRRDFVVNWSLMSRIPLLAELDAREVGELMPLLHAHHVPPRSEVLQAGLPARAMFFVASGKVRMQHPEAEVVFEAGDFFGATAMLTGDAPSAPCITATKCRLLKLHATDFHRLELVNPRFADDIRRRAADPCTVSR
jgi:voltage-gated potassium channel